MSETRALRGGYHKMSPGLFLEKQELERMRNFFQDEGYKRYVLENSTRYGLIDKLSFSDLSHTIKDSFSENGRVFETDENITVNSLDAIDDLGRYIWRDTDGTDIALPDDNQWYWVQCRHAYSSIESGVFEIAANGTLTGDSDSDLLTVLRGKPNFPSKIRFTNSVGNTLEYEVLEVLTDSTAILQGQFVAETDLRISVVGTFTPGFVPTSSEKDIFQYNYSEIRLVQETVSNTAPSKVDGKEFWLARVKKNGGETIIQDKRNEFWRTKASFDYRYFDKRSNPLLGVENIKFSPDQSTKDDNLVHIAWGMRSTNWTIDTNVNRLTIIGGIGGKYKTVADFSTGQFNGWRVYVPSKYKFYDIQSSSLVGGQINLNLATLDVDDFSDDGGGTFTEEEILICPTCESVEIRFIPVIGEDVGTRDDLQYETFQFPVNTPIARCPVLAFGEETCKYRVEYRYVHNDRTGTWYRMPPDVGFGYYAESAFLADGTIKAEVVNNTYTENVNGGFIKLSGSGQIELVNDPNSYSNIIDFVNKGDLIGVENRTITLGLSQYNTVVGTNANYQYYSGGQVTLNAVKYIKLADGLANGNAFMIHIKQQVIPNGHTIKIVSNFVDENEFDLLKEFTAEDFTFLNNSPEGLYFRCSYAGQDEDDDAIWIINSLNETYLPGKIKRTWFGKIGLTYNTNANGSGNGLGVTTQGFPLTELPDGIVYDGGESQFGNGLSTFQYPGFVKFNVSSLSINHNKAYVHITQIDKVNGIIFNNTEDDNSDHIYSARFQGEGAEGDGNDYLAIWVRDPWFGSSGAIGSQTVGKVAIGFQIIETY